MAAASFCNPGTFISLTPSNTQPCIGRRSFNPLDHYLLLLFTVQILRAGVLSAVKHSCGKVGGQVGLKR